MKFPDKRKRDRMVAGFAGPLRARMLLTIRRKAYESALAALPRIDRTALVLGSAPSPTPPAEIDPNWFVITVNASHHLARDLGLGVPDLTIFRDEMWSVGPVSHNALIGGRTRFLIANLAGNSDNQLEGLLTRLDFVADRVQFVSRHIRGAVILEMTGRPFVMLAGRHGISNGVFAALLALKLGAPRVIMTGFSLSNGWYPSGNAETTRGHIPKDRIVCREMARRGAPIFATDPAFSEATGLRLIEGARRLREEQAK
ncbi:MAG: hypothetical protein ABI697_06960 [Devosia sp.]